MDSWPVDAALSAPAATAVVFACVTAPSSPGLSMRTETAVFAGATWAAAAPAAAACPVPAAWPDAWDGGAGGTGSATSASLSGNRSVAARAGPAAASSASGSEIATAHALPMELARNSIRNDASSLRTRFPP